MKRREKNYGGRHVLRDQQEILHDFHNCQAWTVLVLDIYDKYGTTNTTNGKKVTIIWSKN